VSENRIDRHHARWSGPIRGIAAAALSALVLVGCGETPEQMLASAKSYIAKQDFDAASIQLKNALQEDANIAEARFLLGRINLRQGNVTGAVKELERAMELGYARDTVAAELAPALVRAGQFDRVLAEFGDPRVSEPATVAIVHTALGDAHLARRDVDKAQSAYLEALEANAEEHGARIGFARTAAIKGDLQAAEEAVRQVIARAPQIAEAHALLADLLAGRGDLPGAIAALREAVRLQPGTVASHYALVTLLLRQNAVAEADAALDAMKSAVGKHPFTRYLVALRDYRENRLAEARDALMQVLKEAPGLLAAELLVGVVQLRLNDHAIGRAHLDRVLQSAPGNLVARQALVASHLATGEARRALELIQPILQMPQPSARLLGLAGQVFIANGDFERAENYFELAATAAPEDARARTRLGVARMAGGDADAAFAELERASRMDEDAIQADLALVVGHLRRGEADKALAAQAELERKQPDNALVHNLRGGLMLATRDIAAARAAFEKALARQPTYMAAAVNLARLDLAERRPDVAIGRIKAVVDRDPKSVEALLTLADMQRLTGAAPIEVLGTLERAEAVSPGAPVVGLAIIQHHLSEGQSAEALRMAQKLASAHPNDPRVIEALARVQFAAGDSQQAISALNRLVGLLPESPLPLVALAEMHGALMDAQAAEQALRKALAIAPDSMDVRQRMMALALQRKDQQGALRLAREAQSRKPDLPAGYLLEGDVHAVSGQWPDAAEAYRKALERKGGGSAAVRLHSALIRADRKADASRMAQGWLKDNPTDLVLRAHLGELALSEGRHADAVGIFTRMSEMAPQNPIILNNLAWAANEVKHPKALMYAQQALMLAPDNPAIIDTVGTIQVARGEVEEGLANLRRAVSIGPDLLPLQLNLAKALVKAGRKDEARAQLDALLPRLQDGTPIHQEARALQAGL